MNTHQQPSSAAGTDQWARRFLSAGTELGFGDLSMMVGVVSEIITAQKQSHSEAIRERVLDKKNNFCDCSMDETCWDCTQYKMACDDILALLNDSDYGK